MISGPVDPGEAAKKILQNVFKTKNKAERPTVQKKTTPELDQKSEEKNATNDDSISVQDGEQESKQAL